MQLPIPKENILGINASLPTTEAIAQDYQERMLQAFSAQGTQVASLNLDE